MKKIIVIVPLILSLLISAVAMGAEKKPLVLTSLDITQALCSVLCKGTNIKVQKVVPGGYSMPGHNAYFKKHRDVFFEKSAKAQGVISVASVWAGDPLYRWARRGNIRIVNIDAGKPLDGYGAGVPLIEIDGKYCPYVWRSPANLTRMGAIVADDLGMLFPDQAQIINGNLKKLQTALFKLRTEFEETFLENESCNYGALTDGYVYLTDEFGLNVYFYFLQQEDRWTRQDIENLTRLIKENGLEVVICPWEPGEKGKKAISAGGARAVVLSRFVYKEGDSPLNSLLEWYKDNLSGLAE